MYLIRMSENEFFFKSIHHGRHVSIGINQVCTLKWKDVWYVGQRFEIDRREPFVRHRRADQ